MITSGPTQEPIDSVRFLTNRSSGKMGSAIARAALRMGAKVTVVAGPQSEPLPGLATVHRITTAEQMLEKSLELAGSADWIIGVAAVADYRPEAPFEGKIRRETESLHLNLVANPDIIKALSAANPGKLVVGFAAEPNLEVEVAKEKLNRKGLFAIAANDVSQAGIGFDSDENKLTLIFADGHVLESKQESKSAIATWLLRQIIDRSR